MLTPDVWVRASKFANYNKHTIYPKVALLISFLLLLSACVALQQASSYLFFFFYSRGVHSLSLLSLLLNSLTHSSSFGNQLIWAKQACEWKKRNNVTWSPKKTGVLRGLTRVVFLRSLNTLNARNSEYISRFGAHEHVKSHPKADRVSTSRGHLWRSCIFYRFYFVYASSSDNLARANIQLKW